MEAKLKIAGAEVKRMPLSKLRPHPRNPRDHPEPGTPEWDALKASLEHDYFDLLVHNKRNGMLVSGHLRLKVLRATGFTHADVVVVDYDEQTHVARMIAANKLQGSDNQAALFALLREMDGAQRLLTGMGSGEVDALLAAMNGDGKAEAHRTLAEKFGVPPFTVLDARQGYWQDRKRAWIALGIQSEIGRGALEQASTPPDEIHGSPAQRKFKKDRVANAIPSGSAKPACDYSKRERGDGRGRPIPAPNGRKPAAKPADPVVTFVEGFYVVRDDMVLGGTKARLAPLLFGDAAECVYASPVFGYAQVALAYAAQAAGKKATVFCAKRKERHARTAEAAAAGANIIEVPAGYLTVVQKRAREYCAQTGAKLVPFGFDSPEIIAALTVIARDLKLDPLEVWTVAGSGVLTRALQQAWPKASFYAVQVGSEPDAGRATVIKSPLKFEQDARVLPPFPSCSNYDAKAWEFMRERAAKGALFWNVAK